MLKGGKVAQSIVLRGGAQAHSELQVLLLKLNPHAILGPGDWIFPSQFSGQRENAASVASTTAAVQGIEKFTGIQMDPGDMVLYAHWLTPLFDTSYFLGLAPAGASPRPDGGQIVDARWFDPRQALDLHAAGKVQMVYQTVKQLQSLLQYKTAAGAIAASRKLHVEPVYLQVVGEGSSRRAVLPKDAR